MSDPFLPLSLVILKNMPWRWISPVSLTEARGERRRFATGSLARSPQITRVERTKCGPLAGYPVLTGEAGLWSLAPRVPGRTLKSGSFILRLLRSAVPQALRLLIQDCIGVQGRTTDRKVVLTTKPSACLGPPPCPVRTAPAFR